MSLEVIELLVKLVKSERVTVITTIHQPSSEIFRLFDNIVLLKAGKILSYCGNLELIDLFNQNDLKFEKFTNPADHILTVLFDRDNIYHEKFDKICQIYNETQGFFLTHFFLTHFFFYTFFFLHIFFLHIFFF